MLNNIFSDVVSEVSLQEVLICSLCSVIFGFLVALTHKFTSKYNKNFLITITLLPFLVQMVILMVNGNLGTSVAILGAFGLVRFRSIPGTSKEILSVFFAMTVGLASGMGSILFALLITVVGCLAIILFCYIKIFDKNINEKILKITIPENLNYTNVFDEEFKKYTKSFKLEQVKTVNMGSLFDLSYKIVLNKDVNEKQFIDDLRVKNGNLKIILSEVLDNSDL